MGFEVSRLRRGEQIAGIGALLLFVSLFFFDWYGVSASLGPGLDVSASVNGWHGHTVLRWLMLLTIVAAVALVFLAATQRTAALPVTLAVVTTALAALLTLLLAYRVLIDEPGPNQLVGVRFGAYLGLASAAVIFYGAYRSMRDEGTTLDAARARTPAPEPAASESPPSGPTPPPTS